MPWTIDYLPDEKTVLIVSTGETTAADSGAQTKAAIELQAKHDARRFLLDYSKTRVSAPLAEIYNLPDYYQKRGVPHTIRIAVVFPADHYQHEKYEFYEDVCRNRGYTSRVFDNLEAAWAWLKEEPN
ncbi:MAG TPA: hypothetical protein VFL15_06090 [Gammaproteobacteria bacterium]|nr:hypothetical protein [Gammaproteobacteria bacterium]